MRYPQGSGLTAERRAFRERIRMEAAVMSPVSSARTLYMYSLTTEEEQQIEANVVDGDCVTSLPANADKVSNSVQVKRTY